MEDKDLNEKIARACGWADEDIKRGHTLSQFSERLPDYRNDLNAVCAAWKEHFGFFSEEWLAAHQELVKVVAADLLEDGSRCPYVEAAVANASAEQRAQAFVNSLEDEV